MSSAPGILSVSDDHHDGAPSLRCHGELDASSCAILSDAIAAAMDRRPAKLVLDVRGLDFIDSSGLRCILRCQQAADEAGISLALLVVPESAILRLLQLTATESRLDVVIDDSREQPAAAGEGTRSR